MADLGAKEHDPLKSCIEQLGPEMYLFYKVMNYSLIAWVCNKTSVCFLSGILGVFTVFSCLVFSSTIANLYGKDFMIVRYVGNSLHLIYFLITFDFFVFIYCFFELCREALPFFFLLSDFTAVCGMAKFALQSASHVSICTCKRLVQYHSLLSFFHALLCV